MQKTHILLNFVVYPFLCTAFLVGGADAFRYMLQLTLDDYRGAHLLATTTAEREQPSTLSKPQGYVGEAQHYRVSRPTRWRTRMCVR